MPISEDKLADLHVAHLQLVSAAISRMAGYSAACKSYCLTLTTAVFGFAIAAKAALLLWVAILPIVVFALLDARYLSLERAYRRHFDAVRKNDILQPPDFDMAAPIDGEATVFALTSWSVISFYAFIAIVVVAVEFVRGRLNVSL